MHSKRAIKSAKGAQSRYELDTARLGETGSASTADAPANGAGPTGTEATRFAGADDEVQTRTNEVTDALKRTTQVMQAELERSVLSVRMLGMSLRLHPRGSGVLDARPRKPTGVLISRDIHRDPPLHLHPLLNLHLPPHFLLADRQSPRARRLARPYPHLCRPFVLPARRRVDPETAGVR